MQKIVSESNTHSDGISIAALAAEKAGFHGAASSQAAAITAISSGSTADQIIPAVNAALVALRGKGIIAT